MKILFSSHGFAPDIGGIEMVGGILAGEFAGCGHEVAVVTRTGREDGLKRGYRVFRRPGPGALVRLVRWCDVFFHNNISLQTAWPLLFVRRPWVVSHHTWIERVGGRRGWRDRVKLLAIRRARNTAISRALARETGVECEIIGNPYQDDLFKIIPGVDRSEDLIYVGRLVSEKGVALLIEALRRMAERGRVRRLTIVGEGPERRALERQAEGLPITFSGVVSRPELAVLLNRHRTLVLPTLSRETFGVAAIEAIGCGCAVIGADGGGLPEAIGPCGTTFPRGDLPRLMEALGCELPEAVMRAAAAEHLGKFRARAIAESYLRVMAEEISRSGRGSARDGCAGEGDVPRNQQPLSSP